MPLSVSPVALFSTTPCPLSERGDLHLTRKAIRLHHFRHGLNSRLTGGLSSTEELAKSLSSQEVSTHEQWLSEAPVPSSAARLRIAPLNRRSTTHRDIVHEVPGPRDPLEETRRIQLVEVTIDSLAEVGYVGTTLAQISRR